jgi:hypothetical protein
MKREGQEGGRGEISEESRKWDEGPSGGVEERETLIPCPHLTLLIEVLVSSSCTRTEMKI